MASFVNPSKNGNKYQALAQLAQSSQPEKMYDMNLRLLPPSHRTFCLDGGLALAERGGGEGKRMQHIHSTLGENAAGPTNERTSIIRVCALLPFPSPSTTFDGVCCFACSAKISENVPEFPDRRPKSPEKTALSIHRTEVHKCRYLRGKSVFLHRTPDGRNRLFLCRQEK